MNRENLSQKDINLISLLGRMVSIYDVKEKHLATGNLTTHMDTENILKTMVYFQATGQTPDHGLIFSYGEIKSVYSDKRQIYLTW